MFFKNGQKKKHKIKIKMLQFINNYYGITLLTPIIYIII